MTKRTIVELVAGSHEKVERPLLVDFNQLLPRVYAYLHGGLLSGTRVRSCVEIAELLSIKLTLCREHLGRLMP